MSKNKNEYHTYEVRSTILKNIAHVISTLSIAILSLRFIMLTNTDQINLWQIFGTTFLIIANIFLLMSWSATIEHIKKHFNTNTEKQIKALICWSLIVLIGTIVQTLT